jgi:two-component system, cell cycle response regulator
MSGKILIVDDNPLNVKLLAARLTREYYVVVTATNGAAMLAMAQQEPPDLILLDVMMPEMDGYEACRRLRADPRTKAIPVIMVTALSDLEDRLKGLEAGAQDFLSKPIHDTALFARVRSLLRLKLVMDEWRLRHATSSSFGVMPEVAEDTLDEQEPAILVITDDLVELEGITLAIKALRPQVQHVTTLADAKLAMRETAFDVVMCSLALQQDDGLRICPELRSAEATRHMPIILLGDQGDYDRVARGLDLGANDYLLHPMDRVELVMRVTNQVRYRRSYARLQHSYEQSLSLALTDPLTTMFNRRYFDLHLPRLMTRCAMLQKTLSLLVVDVDHFKRINDQFGHAGGDAVLRELAGRLVQNLRPSDFVARYGGEEFVVVLPETDASLAAGIAQRLLQAVSGTPIALATGGAVPQHVTISIGSATMQPDETPAQLFQRADQATYLAKQAGRNQAIAAEPTVDTPIR